MYSPYSQLPYKIDFAVFVTPVGKQVAEQTYYVHCWSSNQAEDIVRHEHHIGPDYMVEAVPKQVADAIDKAMEERGKIIDAE